MDNKLRELRVTYGINAWDMVDEVQKRYPKYDRTLHTKCERGDEYGVELREDAMESICKRFLPEKKPVKARKRDFHRLTYRIYGRLTKTAYTALQRQIKADGFDSVQSWITYAVQRYLSEANGQTKIQERE